MDFRLTRRRLLEGGAALGTSALAGVPRAAAAQHQSITVRMERDIQNMDPANRIGAVEGNIIRSVFPRLVMFRPGRFLWENDAAETIAQIDDTTIEFTLKPGIMWQHGFGELTAEDVRFSYERFNPPEGEAATYAADWSALDHVDVTGRHAGRLVLKHAAPTLWTVALADVSGCIVCKRAHEEFPEEARLTKIVGAGPYMVAEWQPNISVTLRADPNFYGPAPGVPEIILKPIQEPRAGQLAFRAGEIQFTKLEDPAAAEALADDPNARIIKQDSINYVWIGMNVEKPPLDDMRVRRAIRLGIDVEEVILSAYNGTVSRANSLMAPGLLGHWADAPVAMRDPDEAQRLLAEAGYEGGLDLRLTLLDKSQFVTAGQVVQAHLAEIGVNVNLDVLDGSSYWSMGKGGAGETLELSLQEFSGKADPSFQTQWFVSSQVGRWNWQRWRSEEYDMLNREAESETDEAKRGALYVRMQQLMENSQAFIWLTHGVNVFAVKDWLEPAILPNGDDWQLRHFRVEA